MKKLNIRYLKWFTDFVFIINSPKSSLKKRGPFGKIRKPFCKQFTIVIALGLVFLLFVSCAKEVSKSIPTIPKPIGAPLVISSIPEGASIYIDGRISGVVTPDSLTWLDIKNYTVTLKKNLYHDTSFYVNLTGNQRKTLMIDFNSNPNMFGRIRFSSNAKNAKIYVNGKFTGKYTPSRSSALLPGYYNVKYTADNFRSDSLIVTVSSGSNILAYKSLIDTTTWVDYNTHTSGIFDYFYQKIAIDKNDVIWLGSVENGLVRFDGTTWINYRKDNSGLVDNRIKEIKFAPNGHLWICTISGLNEFDGTNWVLYNEQTGLPSNTVNDIAFEADGTPIVATLHGLARYKNNQWEIYRFNLENTNLSSNNYFTGVDVDNEGNWWATRQRNGIVEWDGTNWNLFFTFYSQETQDPYIYYSHVRHADNEIWFAHTVRDGLIVGLSSYSNGRFDKLTYTIFFNKIINSIEIKNGNEKWISTTSTVFDNGGLYRFVDYANLIRYGKENTPMVTNKFEDVAFDSKGDAWVVTLDKGIYHFKINK